MKKNKIEKFRNICLIVMMLSYIFIVIEEQTKRETVSASKRDVPQNQHTQSDSPEQ